VVSASQHLDLVHLFRDRTHPLAPSPTGIEPHLPKASAPIKAVLFDVYGTLISSGVGDISLDQFADQSDLIRKLVDQAGFEWRADFSDHNLAAEFNQEIKADHARTMSQGHPYPEVNILEIWTTLVEGWTEPRTGKDSIRENIATLAVEYECAVNPVWPNEGFNEILHHCREASLPLGIVSNAQFYTPIMLEAFLEKSLKTAGFEAALQVWSYQERRGKPDVALYEKIGAILESEFQIHRSQVIFVGNDMLKDIWAATEAGFKGVLYAGDSRSLRLREDDERCRDLSPYATISSLGQIQHLLV
jgi:putative hydrolase of the HAD superfamily